MVANPVNKYLEDLRRDINDVGALKNSLRFLVVFAVSFLVFMLVLIPWTTGFWDSMGVFGAQTTGGILDSFGVNSSVENNIITTEVQGQNVDFEVSRLCSGDIEIALLVALLLASLDVLLIWRLVGILFGSVLLVLMNPVRIAITLMITRDSGMATGDFYHSVIFRLFLFVLLVLYYFAWYRFFVKRRSKTYERLCKKIKKSRSIGV